MSAAAMSLKFVLAQRADAFPLVYWQELLLVDCAAFAAAVAIVEPVDSGHGETQAGIICEKIIFIPLLRPKKR